MADEKEEPANPWNDLWFILIVLALLILAWFMRGGLQNFNQLKGIFLNAPPPAGNGAVYGPQIAPSYARPAQ